MIQMLRILFPALVLAIAAVPTDARETASPACSVTPPNIDDWSYGNDALQVGLPLNGIFTFEPGGAGFVAVSDGALGIKVLWNRLTPGDLRIDGHRLDASAAPLRSHFTPYLKAGIQPSFVIFPTPGCWEVTGRVGDASLTFVVLVEKIGDGPASRLDL